jgi:DNA primase
MPLDLLSEILQRIRPEQIIGEYVSLRQAGRSLKGLCPFHPEKTPSFHVNPENGLWHCFGCGAGGNLLQFIMKIENLPFPEAKAFLAQKAGMVLEPDIEEKGRRQSRLKHILEKATDFYAQTLLKSRVGEEGLRYLEERGIRLETIEKFCLGMAPPGGHALLRYLENAGFSLREIQEAGLVTRSDFPKDYFLKRIIFPIWNASGNVVAFGGRTLGSDQPKYLNSPDSPLFKKGENLYALHFAKSAIGKEQYVILVEGYIDVLMLHQYGFVQSVASLGTSLTHAQAKLLSRYTQRVVVSYDGDAAGFEAMRRAMGVLQSLGLEMALIALPQGEDPDTFLKQSGSGPFQGLLQRALSPVDFVLTLGMQKYDPKTPEGKKKIVDEVLSVIEALRDPILRDEYLKKTAQSLDVSETALRRRLHRPPSKNFEMEVGQPISREEEILKWILWEPHLSAMIWSEISPEDFQEPQGRACAEVLYRLWKEGKKEVKDFQDLPEPITAFLSRLSVQPPVGGIEGVKSLLEAQKQSLRKKDLMALKEEVNKRLKEGKLKPTDEAYKMYIELLRQMKSEKGGSL